MLNLQHAVGFDLFANLFDFGKHGVGLVGVDFNGHFLHHKVDVGVAYAFNLFDGTFHFCGAVGAVEILQSNYFFHSGVSLGKLFMVLLRDFSRERQFCAHRSAAVLCVAGGGNSCVTSRFRSGYRRLFRQVVERKFDYAVHVVVVKAVVNFFAYAFVAYQFCLAQYAQLVADG